MTSSDEDEQPCSSATGDLDESNDPIAAQSQSVSSATVSAIDEDKTDASNQREPDPTPPGKLVSTKYIITYNHININL